MPYKLFCLESGELKLAASKTVRLRVFKPSSRGFRNLGSCSNFTDYESRSARVLLDDGRLAYYLCGTFMQTELALYFLLENGATSDGVKLPEVLAPYMGDIRYLPYLSRFSES
jgi:seryl-tRNA synthetase